MPNPPKRRRYLSDKRKPKPPHAHPGFLCPCGRPAVARSRPNHGLDVCARCLEIEHRTMQHTRSNTRWEAAIEGRLLKPGGTRDLSAARRQGQSASWLRKRASRTQATDIMKPGADGRVCVVGEVYTGQVYDAYRESRQ